MSEIIGTIAISVKAGVGLPIKDVLARSSDPYVRIDHPGIENSKHRYKSSIQYKTLNPTWTNETCLINLFDKKISVTIEIWDDDGKFSPDEFMGACNLHLDGTGLADEYQVDDQWIPLHGKKEKTDKNLGKICVSYKVQFLKTPKKVPSDKLEKSDHEKEGKEKDKHHHHLPLKAPSISMLESKRSTILGSKSSSDKRSALTGTTSHKSPSSAKKQPAIHPIFACFQDSPTDVLPLKKYVNKLKNPGTEINVQDKQGQTPLHLACYGKIFKDGQVSELNQEAIVEFLLDVPGINVKLENSSKNTPLHYFCSNWKDPSKAITFLHKFLALGADVDATNESNETPLFKSIANEYVRFPLMKALFATGKVDATRITTTGQTLLHYAAWKGRLDLVELILENSPESLKVVNNEGKTALETVKDLKKETNPADTHLLKNYDEVEKALTSATSMFDFLDAADLPQMKKCLISQQFDMDILSCMTDAQIYALDFPDFKMGQKVQLIKALKEYKEIVLPTPKKSISQKLREAKGEPDRQDCIDNIEAYLKQMRADKSANEFLIIKQHEIEYLEELGSGAFGAVWKGLLKTEGRRLNVAIKVLFEVKGAELESFKSEFSILNAVRDRNIVTILGVCLIPKLGMVMEYCANGSLHHVLKKKGVDYGWETFFKMAPQILLGIQALHENKPQILHRDLKSLNILVTDTMECRVADFGLARENTSLSSDSLKSIEGTVQYMPPELLSRVKYSTKSDIFSLSIIFWEMIYRVVTGQYLKPYGDEPDLEGPASSMILYCAVANNNLRPKFPPSTPSDIMNVIHKGWLTDPAQRPTLDELSNQLEHTRSVYKKNGSWPQVRFIDNSEPVFLKFNAAELKRAGDLALNGAIGARGQDTDRTPDSARKGRSQDHKKQS